MRIEAEGYEPCVLEGVTVDANGPTYLDAELAPM